MTIIDCINSGNIFQFDLKRNQLYFLNKDLKSLVILAAIYMERFHIMNRGGLGFTDVPEDLMEQAFDMTAEAAATMRAIDELAFSDANDFWSAVAQEMKAGMF